MKKLVYVVTDEYGTINVYSSQKRALQNFYGDYVAGEGPGGTVEIEGSGRTEDRTLYSDGVKRAQMQARELI